MKHRYIWWAGGEPCQRTLFQQIREAIESRKWTLTYPHRFACEEALRVHKAAAKRFWHGWELGTIDRVIYCGWTLHIGRLKVIFGPSFWKSALENRA